MELQFTNIESEFYRKNCTNPMKEMWFKASIDMQARIFVQQTTGKSKIKSVEQDIFLSITPLSIYSCIVPQPKRKTSYNMELMKMALEQLKATSMKSSTASSTHITITTSF